MEKITPRKMPPQMMPIRWRFEQKKGEDVHKLYLYDDISKYGEFNWETFEFDESETSAKYIRDRLDEIPENSTIEVHVNSRGGDVGEGTAISSLLRQKAEQGNCLIIGYVDGYAYSIAMTIMMACNEIRMMPGSTMFLHYPWMACAGNADDLRNFAVQLDSLGDASVALYMERAGSHITEDELRELIKAETCLSPEDCLKYGFCDVVESKAAEPEKEPEKDPEKAEEPRQAVGIEDRLQKIEEMLEGIRAAPAAPKVTEEPKEAVKNTLIDAMRRMSVNK